MKIRLDRSWKNLVQWDGQGMEWDELLGHSQPNPFHGPTANLQDLGRREKRVAPVPVPLEPRLSCSEQLPRSNFQAKLL